jgi:hypothetical protein
MNLELPQDLQSTRDMLAGSLQMHASEKAPSLPGDLFEDMFQRFSQAPSVATAVESRTWFAAIQSFISRPAFGVAAFAVVVIGLALPNMMSPTVANAGFRGAVPVETATGNVRIVLIKAPSDIQKLIESSGDFEKGVISSVEMTAGADTGARVLVDFGAYTITAIDANGEAIHAATLPGDSNEISSAIALAVSKL